MASFKPLPLGRGEAKGLLQSWHTVVPHHCTLVASTHEVDVHVHRFKGQEGPLFSSALYSTGQETSLK